MDAELEKAVADYLAKTAKAEDVAKVKKLPTGSLARKSLRNGRGEQRQCFVMGGKNACEITEGAEVLVPTDCVRKSFPVGTPPDVIEKYFEDAKMQAIRLMQKSMKDAHGVDGEVTIMSRSPLSVYEKDGELFASEEYGVLVMS